MEGFGTDTSAGRGGQVIRVTTLEDATDALPGSLREAIEAEGPRIIVFEVGGIINLARGLNIRNPYVTIAGQTAPSPGITLAGDYLRAMTHDVLVQHLRVRVGDVGGSTPPADRDGVQVITDLEAEATADVVFDHCSVSWAVDENVGTGWGGVSDITMRHCIVSEGLNNSTHPKGAHSMGLLVGDHTHRMAVIGCLFAHNVRRNPGIFGDTSSLVVNNVVYNPYSGGIHLNDFGGSGPILSSVVGNVIVPGPDTPEWLEPVHILAVPEGTGVYLADNVAIGREVVVVDASEHDVILDEPQIWTEPLTVRPSGEVLEWVLANAGARPWDRDDVDERIISDVRNGTGRIIDSQDEVGGWPELGESHHVLDLPNNPWGDDNGDGVSNLEEWLMRMGGRDMADIQSYEGSVLDAVGSVQAALEDLQAQVVPSTDALATAIAALQVAQAQLDMLAQAITDTKARLAG